MPKAPPTSSRWRRSSTSPAPPPTTSPRTARWGVDNTCDGVVECTALVLAESCTEVEDRLTLFGILDEILPAEEGETSFVVYAKFEGCEHASDKERRARIVLRDDHRGGLMEADEYAIWLDGA